MWRGKQNKTIAATWVRIRDGPLRQHELLLAPESPALWNREMLEGRYDSFLYDALAQSGVKIEAATIWDVGAHIGYHSLCFASLVGPSGRVAAFEPNPYNSDRFQQNLERNPDLAQRISLFQFALSDTDGEEMFRFSTEVDNGKSSGSHLQQAITPENAKAYRSFAETHVRTFRADTLKNECQAPAPSVMKIDVEGAEFSVLKGSSGLLSSEKPILFIEIHNISMMFNVQRFLYRFGYELSMFRTEHDSISRGFFLARPQR